MAPRLVGSVAIVAVGDERAAALTRALAEEGATIILVADDAAGGRLAAELRAGSPGARVAVFCPGNDQRADGEALVELAAELSPRR